MKSLVLSLTLAFLASSTAIAAESTGNTLRPGVTQICLDVDGSPSSFAAVCRGSGNVSRSEDICTCPAGGVRTDTEVCNAGEAPVADSVAGNRARKAAAADGSLLGDTHEGRRFCVPPRR